MTKQARQDLAESMVRRLENALAPIFGDVPREASRGDAEPMTGDARCPVCHQPLGSHWTEYETNGVGFLHCPGSRAQLES